MASNTALAEFVLIAGLVSPFALSYLQYAQLLCAFVAVGIILSCLTVARVGVRRWGNRAPAIGWPRFLDQQERDRFSHPHPHLLQATTVMTITAFVPYALLVLTTWEGLTQRKEGKS